MLGSSLLTLEHVFQDKLGNVKRAININLHNAIKILVGVINKWGRFIDAGVIDQNIDLPLPEQT
jgi:hypothetical protein